MNEKDSRVILTVAFAEEDRAAIRETWKGEREYKILEAHNAAEAEKLLRESSDIDLIFLDIIKPETDGLNFLSQIKKSEEFSYLPVVVNSQPGRNARVERALVLGAEDFVLMPYNFEVLRKRISKVITRNLCDRDPQTNLYTAQTFYNQTRKMIRQRIDIPYAMLYFNVRGFTQINDFYGTETGDSILVKFAEILRECVGVQGTYGKIIADNFVCCLATPRGNDEIRLFHKVEERLESLRRQYHFNIECGIYKIEDMRISVPTMCDRAKFAMSRIRENMGERYAYYDVDAAEHYRYEQRIVADMETALEENQFFIMLQPIYDTAGEYPVSAEALVRWKHPELGLIRPDVYIPLFEQNGFIRQLDVYVWEEACKVLAEMRRRGMKPLPISMNASRIDLFVPGLADSIEDLLEKYDLPKELLQLEITESAYMEKPQEMIRLITDLKHRGFVLLMDDFGSGYSSLNMLKEMPVDILKIDMQFMRELTTSQKAGNILISIIRMAKLLNIKTVAEGVETKEQLEFLKNVGCDKIQGYYFSKPLPANEYIDLVERETNYTGERNVYKKGILIVDDSTVLRKSLIEALGDSYKYYEAENGKEALEVLNKRVSAISIIITDIFMPEMDGYELIHELQNNSVFSHVPIIVITASETRESEIKALQLGAVDVITKPYDPDVVSQRVRNVMKLSETEWLQMEMRLMNSAEQERRDAATEATPS